MVLGFDNKQAAFIEKKREEKMGFAASFSLCQPISE